MVRIKQFIHEEHLQQYRACSKRPMKMSYETHIYTYYLLYITTDYAPGTILSTFRGLVSRRSRPRSSASSLRPLDKSPSCLGRISHAKPGPRLRKASGIFDPGGAEPDPLWTPGTCQPAARTRVPLPSDLVWEEAKTDGTPRYRAGFLRVALA